MKDTKTQVFEPESIVINPPKGIKKSKNDLLFLVTEHEQWQRYKGGTLVMLSSFKDSLAFKGIEKFKNEAIKIYKKHQPDLNKKFIKIEGNGKMLKDWYYINNDSFTELGTIIHCSESFGQTIKEKLDDSSCFVKGKYEKYYFSYSIYHDEFLKHGNEIHSVIIATLKNKLN
ncbi:MAG: hypothetical protein AB8B80_08880 [Marinicellaceae bacterium]